MLQAIRRRVTVQPGGRIEIVAPELTPGSQAEVIVLEERALRRRPLAELIGQGKGAHANPEEADAFLRQERDAWR
jgi:hypothetical protein